MMEMLILFTAPAPGFESVTGCATLVDPKTWFVNVRLPGVALTACTPMPLRETVCVRVGGAPVLSVIVSVPDCKPVALGLKVTAMKQLLSAAKVDPHVLPSVPLGWATKGLVAAIDVMV